MHNLPRIIIAIPIAVIVLVVYIKMAFPNQLRMLTSTRSESLLSGNPTATAENQESIPVPQKSEPVSFDIVKPRTCEYSNEALTAYVFIQNSKVSATITQKDGIKNIVLLHDCVHIWQEGESSGQQICGVSQYLGLFQTYSSFLSPSMITSMIPGLSGIGARGSGDMLSSVLNSCVDGSVDEREFVLPTNVIFKESSPGEVQESFEL